VPTSLLANLFRLIKTVAKYNSCEFRAHRQCDYFTRQLSRVGVGVGGVYWALQNLGADRQGHDCDEGEMLNIQKYIAALHANKTVFVFFCLIRQTLEI